MRSSIRRYEWRAYFSIGSAVKATTQLLKEAIEQETDVMVVGYLRPDQAITISDRHLGLVTAMEQGTGELYGRLAKAAEETVDLDRIEALAQAVKGKALGVRGERGSAGQDQNRHAPHRVRIGIAYDQAFCFYYPDNLELLEVEGAEIGEIFSIE